MVAWTTEEFNKVVILTSSKLSCAVFSKLLMIVASNAILSKSAIPRIAREFRIALISNWVTTVSSTVSTATVVTASSGTTNVDVPKS